MLTKGHEFISTVRWVGVQIRKKREIRGQDMWKGETRPFHEQNGGLALLHLLRFWGCRSYGLLVMAIKLIRLNLKIVSSTSSALVSNEGGHCLSSVAWISAQTHPIIWTGNNHFLLVGSTSSIQLIILCPLIPTVLEEQTPNEMPSLPWGNYFASLESSLTCPPKIEPLMVGLAAFSHHITQK